MYFHFKYCQYSVCFISVFETVTIHCFYAMQPFLKCTIKIEIVLCHVNIMHFPRVINVYYKYY